VFQLITESDVAYQSAFRRVNNIWSEGLPFPTSRKRMDELARKYVEAHDKEIIEELYELSRELEKMEKQSES